MGRGGQGQWGSAVRLEVAPSRVWLSLKLGDEPAELCLNPLYFLKSHNKQGDLVRLVVYINGDLVQPKGTARPFFILVFVVHRTKFITSSFTTFFFFWVGEFFYHL